MIIAVRILKRKRYKENVGQVIFDSVVDFILEDRNIHFDIGDPAIIKIWFKFKSTKWYHFFCGGADPSTMSQRLQGVWGM